MSEDWFPIEQAPYNTRIFVQQTGEAPNDEFAIAWLDRLDGKFYYAPQGGVLPWKPDVWQPMPEATPALRKAYDDYTKIVPGTMSYVSPNVYDGVRITLSPEGFDKFVEALDNPEPPTEKLIAMFKRPTVWVKPSLTYEDGIRAAAEIVQERAKRFEHGRTSVDCWLNSVLCATEKVILSLLERPKP